MTDETETLDQSTLDNIALARTYRGLSPHHYLVPYRNIGNLLEMRASETPNKVFLIYYDIHGTRSEFTYAEFNARVNQTANLLAYELGVEAGDRVATIAFNHSDTVILYYACWKLGAAVAPQNVTEDDGRISFILRNSESVVVFVREEYLDRAEKIVHGESLNVPNLRRVIQWDGEPRPGYLHYPTAIAKHPTTFAPAYPPTLESESLLVYTSGTTGAPKGVVLLQYNMLADARAISDWQGLTGNQRLMCVLPIHHVNGTIMTLVTPLYVGGSVVLNRQYQSSTFWQRIAREKVHIVSVVPTLLQFSCEYADTQQAAGKSPWGEGVTRDDLQHFRHLVCGAGTLAVALARRFEDKFSIPVLHGYGLSETTCYSCFLPIALDWKTHQQWMQDYGYPSIGCPINANEMAIFDISGQQLGPGERGEICVRGHNVMKYYYQRPDANRETFKFGWFRSGDEGFFQVDEQGRQFFFITGRLKELINRGGVKFSPFDIEEVLLEIPGVKVGLAVAFENDYYGEEVGAYVVYDEGAASAPSEADILAYCRQRMSFEKAPKVVIFGTEIPVTTTGKYQRLKLRDRFADWKETQFRKP